MEWVETTGRTVEEAKEAALDELGVDESEAEFEIIEEPRAGLFGRLRTEARVRARVQPTAPRSKDDRRDRRRRRSGSAPAPAAPASGAPADSPVSDTGERSAATATAEGQPRGRNRRSSRRGGGGGSGAARPAAAARATEQDRLGKDLEQEGAGVEVELEKQGQVAEEFLTHLMAEIGVSGSVSVSQPDEETVELQLSGSDLGILIGPKGSTLLAIQNLVRNVVHHETGANNGHVNVDVGGYRQKRSEALARFAEQVATTVKQTGERTAMEPMSSIDRKVVHDAISEIEGVSTVSEGEEPRRRVVVLPAPAES